MVNRFYEPMNAEMLKNTVQSSRNMLHCNTSVATVFDWAVSDLYDQVCELHGKLVQMAHEKDTRIIELEVALQQYADHDHWQPVDGLWARPHNVFQFVYPYNNGWEVAEQALVNKEQP